MNTRNSHIALQPLMPPSNSTDWTEADVEQKVLYPILIASNYLEIPQHSIKLKNYLSSTQLDKNAGSARGYFPDYSVWENALPVMVVEAKSPDVDVSVGYREAALYARHLNHSYKSGVNPCRFIVACNGHRLLAGYWDSVNELELPIEDLRIGTTSLDTLRTFCGHPRLLDHASKCLAAIRQSNFSMPYGLVGGQAIINAKQPYNTFAADLSPVLRKYFTSASQDKDPAIYERAYVSSDHVTKYDQILEQLLKERIATRRSSISKSLRPTRTEEPQLSAAIKNFRKSPTEEGHLQLITGGVGVGKSLFARRYKEMLQPLQNLQNTHWGLHRLQHSSDFPGRSRGMALHSLCRKLPAGKSFF